MGNQKSIKGIIVTGTNKALSKNVNASLFEFQQMFLSKRLGRNGYEEALCYLHLILDNELDKEKPSVVKLQKILLFILYSLNEYTKEQFIAVELLVDLRKIEKKYAEFKEKNEKFNNKEIDDLVEEVETILIKIRPELSEEDISAAQKLKEKNDRLHKEIDEKDNEIAKLRKELETFSKNLKRDDKFEDKYKEKEKEIAKLEDEIKKLKKEISSLTTKYEQQLLNEKDEKNKYIEEIKTFKDNEEKEKQRIEILDSEKKRDELIESIIINALIKENYRENNLYNLLHQNGLEVSRSELRRIITKTKFKIKTLAYSNGTPIIGMDNSTISNTELNFKCVNELKCIFISNINFNGDDKDIYNSIERIYNYCITHKINYIFILGNLFSVDNINSYEEAKKVDLLLNNIIKYYPVDDSITNFTLGGNNELMCSNIGFDSQKIISDERFDFSNINYTNATITINKIKNVINIHSKNLKDYNSIFEYTNQYYNDNNIDNPITFDIISTTGESSVDMNNRIITIPSLMNTDKGCNIYHVDISIKDDEIKKFSIYPMINNEKLIHTSHLYVYK